MRKGILGRHALKRHRLKRRLSNILLLLILLVIFIGVYYNINNSKAEDVISVKAVAIDKYGYLSDEEISLTAKYLYDDLYSLELPENINGKKINNLLSVSIGDDKAALNEENAEENVETNEEENVEENNAFEVIDNAIQLTKEQLENISINLEVEYDVAILEQNEEGEYNKNLLSEKTEEERQAIEITEDTKVLYKKDLKYEDESQAKVVELIGYLPKDAELRVAPVAIEDIQSLFEGKTVKTAYDIKIVVPQINENEKIEYIEINPEDFGETCEVSIQDSNIVQDAQVYHIKEDNTVEEVEVKENVEENVTFDAGNFSIYAVTANSDISPMAVDDIVISDVIIYGEPYAPVLSDNKLRVNIKILNGTKNLVKEQVTWLKTTGGVAGGRFNPTTLVTQEAGKHYYFDLDPVPGGSISSNNYRIVLWEDSSLSKEIRSVVLTVGYTQIEFNANGGNLVNSDGSTMAFSSTVYSFARGGDTDFTLRSVKNRRLILWVVYGI